jgi:hypothetical protein
MQAFYHLSTNGRFGNVFAELLYHIVVDIRFQKSLAHLSHSVGDIGFGDSASAGQRPEN